MKFYYPRKNMKAAHILMGTKALQAIFDTGKAGMFSPLDSLMLNEDVEELFDQYFSTIIPDVKSTTDEEEVKQGHRTRPREYKLRVLDFAGRISMHTLCNCAGRQTYSQ